MSSDMDLSKSGNNGGIITFVLVASLHNIIAYVRLAVIVFQKSTVSVFVFTKLKIN